MKRVRLFAMLLTAALFTSSIPVTGVSAAQKTAETETIIIKEEAAAAAPAAAKLGWVKKGNSWYYVTKKGYLTGWAVINGKCYYFNKNGIMHTGFIRDGGKWYLCAQDGHMKVGWQKVGGRWYFFDLVHGDMKTGWLYSNGSWYYLEKNTGVMVTGWKKVDGKWYYLGEGGAMFTGPHVYKIDGVYYFFEKSGALTTKTGLQVSDTGNTFYTNKDGTVVTNKEIGGKIINGEGIAVNKVNDVMDQKAQWYDSDTQYLVLADLSEHALRIYQGKKGQWTRIKGDWEFSCGAPATRTPCGQFELCWKYETEYGWKRFEKCKAAYVYWTTAGFMLHTILYDKYSEGNPEYADIADDRLGMNISMSCIRLALENARWIYTNIPHGTKLVVYE